MASQSLRIAFEVAHSAMQAAMQASGAGCSYATSELYESDDSNDSDFELGSDADMAD